MTAGRRPVQSAAVPRHRTARTAVLGVNVRRPVTGKPPSRSTSAFRRRLVIGVLVVLALVLITVSFRKPDDGPVASAQSAAAAVLRPFTIAGERVAQPFRDVYAWADSLLTARSDAKRLRAGERGPAPAGDPEPVRGERERQAQGAARVPRRPALPGRLHGPRRGGDRAADGRVRAGRRRRGRLERRRRARRPGRHRGRVPRSRDARLLALGARDAAHRRAARRLGARRQDRRRRHRQARPRLGLDAHLRPRPEEAQGLGRRHDRHRRLALEQARLALSARDPDRARDERRAGRHRPLEAGPGASRSPTSIASTPCSCSSARTRQP